MTTHIRCSTKRMSRINKFGAIRPVIKTVQKVSPLTTLST